MFIFDFSRWTPGQASTPLPSHSPYKAMYEVVSKRVTVVNSYLSCLYTALWRRQERPLSKMVLSPSELLAPHLPYENTSEGVSGMFPTDMRAWALSRTRDPQSYAQGVPNSGDWRLIDRRELIEVETVKESFQLLDTIFQHPDSDNLLTFSDLYLRSCRAYEEANHSLCLVTAWTIIERLLQQLWESYIEDNRKREIDGREVSFINGERKKRLEDGRNFTASVISEIVSLVNYLSFQLYKELMTLRKARNDWIHGLKPVTAKMSERAVKATEGMIDLVEGVSLEARLAGYAFTV